MKIYDIIIVGSGPAGSTAAYYIQNKNVLIVDKFDFPREKACGGGLLNCRDWSQEFENFKNIENKFEKEESSECEIYLSTNHLFSASTNHFFDQVSRSEFDWLLLQEALKKENVEWRKFSVLEIKKEKDFYVLSDGKEEILAKKIVGADGAGSVAALFLGNRPFNINQVGNCLEYDLHCQKIAKAIHLFFGFRGEIGYGWVFPTKNGYILGLGFARKTKHNLKHYLDDLLRECIEKKIIPLDYEIKKVLAGLAPIITKKKYCSEDIFLCGDAAGLVSQWGGEGIYSSMKSGKKLGELLNREEKDLEEKYKKIIHELLFWRMRITGWIPPKVITIPLFWLTFKFLALPEYFRINIWLKKACMNMFSRRYKLPKGSFYRKF